MEQNPIRYQDLISPDDSIEKLISQLQQLQEAYSNMAEKIKAEAQGVAQGLSKVSGATEQGRKSIKQSSDETAKLEKAYKRLDEAMSANGKEIQRLNRVRQEYVRYQKNIQQRGQEEIRTMKQIKEASYQQLSAQYSLNKAYINSLTAKDRMLAKNKELIKSTKEIYEQMKRLQADTGKMQLNVGNYPSLEKILGSAVGISGAAGAAMAAVTALKTGIGTAMDFQKQLSGLAAILGTTKDKLNELTEQSRDLGATTIFTASEVVQLQTELAKLGYTVDDILKMTPSVLQFSQATGSSLADAASLTGAALRMFEKDATHTQEFVDKMSASTTKSALSFSYLQNAMSTVSPVANAFGFELEDVLSLLGQLANAGFDASSAATATRNIILNLADANGKLAQALGQPVTNLNDLIKGLKELNDKGIDLAESLELTDKRSVAAFNTFLAGTDTVIDLRDELSSCDGVAAQMAKTMGDNLAGSIKTLQSAWQDFMIELNQDQGLLSGVVQLLTTLVKAINTPFKWFNKRTAEQRKEAESRNALRYYANINPDDVETPTFDIYKPNESAGQTEAGTTKKQTKPTKKPTKSQLKQQEAAAKAALKEQEKHEKESLELRRKYEDLTLELIEDEQVRERAKIVQTYDRQIEDLRIKLEKEKTLTVDDRKVINDQVIAIEQVKQVKLADLAEKQAKKAAETAEKEKKAKEQAAQNSMRERERAIELQYRTDMEEIEMLETSEKEKTRLRLEAEKERLKKLLALYQQDGKKLAGEEIKLIKKQIAGVDNELQKNQKRDSDIYDVLGFNLSDEKKEAIDLSLSYAMDGLNQFVSAWTEAADKKRQVADAEVERTKNVLQAEIEARANGYANEVDMARKEYEESKKMQAKAAEQQKRAQRAQIALDTASQASNLVTATSVILKQFGMPWAIPMIALMWGTFAAAKVKALQSVSAGTEKYAEGTVEMLQGGSHASGNDIDLGRKADGTRRRAEGGEFFAVINKRNSRKYRSVIPDVINSLNAGTFADKYMNAYDGGAINIQPMAQQQDLTRLSDDVHSIREQGERMTLVDKNGYMVVTYKNLKRVIKN